MALAPALDLREPPPDDSMRLSPSNMEAEQALLGSILYDNDALAAVSETLAPAHFYEPFHGRLFAAVARLIRLGIMADPTTIAESFQADAAFKELGGIRYLAALVDRAPPSSRAPSYATTILDLAMRRELIRTAGDIVQRAATQFVDDNDKPVDAQSLAEALGAAVAAIQLQSSRDRPTAISEAVAGVAAYSSGERTDRQGVRTGINPVDLALGPIMPGDLILLAARPSMGKSMTAGAFALGVAAPALADEMAGRDYDGRQPAGVFEAHGEMSFGDAEQSGQQARRHLSNVGFHMFGGGFPTYKMMRDGGAGRHARDIQAAARAFGDVPIVGLKRTGIKVSTLRALIRRQVAAWAKLGVPPGLVVVDHVGLLRADGRVTSRYEAQTEIAIGLKELADELAIPILALVQLSREIERRDDKRPQLSDLRDSGAWEENADAVVFVYRDAYYARREPEPDAVKEQLKFAKWNERQNSKEVELIVAKLREGEAGKTAKVWGDLGHNAIRAVQPENRGGFL